MAVSSDDTDGWNWLTQVSITGSPWGAGTYAGGGTRNPTALELEIAKKQGQKFFETVSKVAFN